MSKKTEPKLKRPPGLSSEEAAVWDHVVANAAARIATEDTLALEAFCRAYVTLQAALTALRRELVVELHNGTKAANPHLKIVNVLRHEVSEGYVRFGLSPAARAKANLTAEDEEERAFAAEFD